MAIRLPGSPRDSSRCLGRASVGRSLGPSSGRGLKHNVAPGLGCLQNEHLLALNLNPARKMTLSAANAVDELFPLRSPIVRVLLPESFYQAWVACRMVPANKLLPDDLPPRMTHDCTPVNIGGAEQRLVTRAYFDDDMQGCYNCLVQLVQN